MRLAGCAAFGMIRRQISTGVRKVKKYPCSLFTPSACRQASMAATIFRRCLATGSIRIVTLTSPAFISSVFQHTSLSAAMAASSSSSPAMIVRGTLAFRVGRGASGAMTFRSGSNSKDATRCLLRRRSMCRSTRWLPFCRGAIRFVLLSATAILPQAGRPIPGRFSTGREFAHCEWLALAPSLVATRVFVFQARPLMTSAFERR